MGTGPLLWQEESHARTDLVLRRRLSGFRRPMDKEKTSGPHGPSPPCEGRGTVQSTVGGASAAADTLQEPWTTVGRVVEIWNGKIGDPEAPVSVFPTEWKLDVRQGIRSFQDLMPPPPGKPGPPPLQGGLGLRLCWYSLRVYVDTPGAGRAGPGGVGGITSTVVA